MQTIKKVAVTPVAENTGAIIDSTSSSDDKHTNTYSMSATDELISNAELQSSSTSILNIKSTDESVNLSFYFYKYGKMVTCHIIAGVQPGAFGFKSFNSNPTIPVGYRPRTGIPFVNFYSKEIKGYSTDSGGSPTKVDECEVRLQYFLNELSSCYVYNKDQLNTVSLTFLETYITAD